jgi:isopentenyldiphosphate isomerase
MFSWPYYQRDPQYYKKVMSDFYYFMIGEYPFPFGYVHFSFVNEMCWPDFWHLDHERRVLTLACKADFAERTNCVQSTLRQGHEDKVPRLQKWANEVMPLYSSTGEHVLDMDLVGVDQFGIVTYGVHLTAYVETSEGRMYWVPRRSKTKSTFPGMLDNSVAGNLISTERPIDGIVREVAEEAGISEEYTRANIRACGTVTYQMSETNAGDPGTQHHTQYVYELELRPDIKPFPFDGEVEEFQLMCAQGIFEALHRGEFKPNTTMTWIAHFIRHGILNAENEKDLAEICARLHRKHDMFII